MGMIGRKILFSALTIGSLNGFVMAGAVLRDLFLAHRFGTGPVVDGFLVGLLIPTIVVQIIAVSLSLALMPEIIHARSFSERYAAALSGSGLFIGTAMLAIITVTLYLAEGAALRLLNLAFDDRRAELTRYFYLGLLPCIVIQGWSILVGCFLNAKRHFSVVAISPVLRPFAVCLAVISSTETSAASDILFAYVGGALGEAAWITLTAYKARVMPLLMDWTLSQSMRKVLAEFRMVVIGTGLLSFATMADQYFASFDGLGGIATYSYGTKIVAMLMGVGALPLGVAVLPHFAEQVREGKWQDLRAILVQWSGVLVAVTGPVVLAIWVYSAELIKFAFQRGAFSSSDTASVAQVQQFLILQLPFYLCGVLYIRALISLQCNSMVALVGGVNATVNIVGSLILIRTNGVPGIAIAATAGYVTANCLAGVLVFRKIRLKSQDV